MNVCIEMCVLINICVHVWWRTLAGSGKGIRKRHVRPLVHEICHYCLKLGDGLVPCSGGCSRYALVICVFVYALWFSTACPFVIGVSEPFMPTAVPRFDRMSPRCLPKSVLRPVASDGVARPNLPRKLRRANVRIECLFSRTRTCHSIENCIHAAKAKGSDYEGSGSDDEAPKSDAEAKDGEDGAGAAVKEAEPVVDDDDDLTKWMCDECATGWHACISCHKV